MIQELIDKQDSFEIIRDKIALILANETANQQTLATNGGKNPELWKIRVYAERSNPFENFLNEVTDKSPIVNIWTDNLNYEKNASTTFERHKTTCVYNIDCYGYGEASDNVSGGHIAGDYDANINVQRCIRLVRNILMSSIYHQLDLTGLVWHKWIDSVSFFQPEINANSMQKISGARLSLAVTFNEFSPQYIGTELDYIAIDIKRSLDGQIIAEADYDYT